MPVISPKNANWPKFHPKIKSLHMLQSTLQKSTHHGRQHVWSSWKRAWKRMENYRRIKILPDNSRQFQKSRNIWRKSCRTFKWSKVNDFTLFFRSIDNFRGVIVFETVKFFDSPKSSGLSKLTKVKLKKKLKMFRTLRADRRTCAWFDFTLWRNDNFEREHRLYQRYAGIDIWPSGRSGKIFSGGKTERTNR